METHRNFIIFLALHGHLEVVRILLKRGDYRNDIADSCGSTPLMDAIKSGYTDIAELLISSNKVHANQLHSVWRLVCIWFLGEMFQMTTINGVISVLI